MPTRKDPTRTTLLRRQFERDIRKRINAVKKAIVTLIVDEDAFGLEEGSPFIFNAERQRFRFNTNPQKVDAFRKFLDEQWAQNLLSQSVGGDPFTAKYIDSAYRRGTVRAFIDTRGVAAAQGAEFFEGTKAEFLRQAFTQPERVSKVALLATRAFEELRGVSAVMSQQLSRALATGLIAGDAPRTIARGMVKTVDKLTKTRALLIAQTEVIAAHAQGQLDSFKDLGVEELGIASEFSTAGDARVCPQCDSLNGQVFTIKEAQGVIPQHARCRCSWIPGALIDEKERRKKLIKALNDVMNRGVKPEEALKKD